jgi:DNA mismatch repair protein MutS
MHNVQQGAASKSYGLQVAQLAGVPEHVIQVAKQKLTTLETQSIAVDSNKTDSATETNAASLVEPVQLALDNSHQALIDTLDQISADELSPKQALDFIYVLKSMR